MPSIFSTDTTQIRWRRHGGDAAAAAAAAGVAGLIIGSMIAAPRYYDGPYPYHAPGYYPPGYAGPVGAGPDWEAYCFSRYRSFDPVSGTYLGYDGRRHYCQ